MKKIKFIDLFAGAGGLTLGFVKNGFEPIETIEFWKPATETYNYNFQTNIKTKDITDSNVRNSLKKYQNKIDLVIGGFPCQGFSMSGKRDKNDPRNQLYKYTIDVIKKVQPKFFVLENVKGILSFKEKDNVLVITKIKNMLKKNGYYSKLILVDSSKFGVPQKRERVIFIGAKNKYKSKVDQCINKIANYKKATVTVESAIKDLETTKENIKFNHIFTKHSKEFKKKIHTTKVGESAMKNFSDAFRRIDYKKPSPTVKENHGGVFIHPKFDRVLTPRELARLQSFPDNFIFKGTKSSILKQIGNAVPPMLSYAIANIAKGIFYGSK